VTTAPDALPDDTAALKRIIADMARDAVAAQTEITKLKFQPARYRYRRAEFGRSSETVAREVAQLELAIETLETDQAKRLAAASPAVAAAVDAPSRLRLPQLRRRPATGRRGGDRDP
jgi:transposase